MTTRPDLVTETELAAVFGLSVKAMQDWYRDGMPHRKRDGRRMYVVAECVQWRRARDKDMAAKRPVAVADQDTEKTRKTKADADLAELRLRERRGELMATADVEAEWTRILGLVRTRILGLRARFGPKAVGLTSVRAAAALFDEVAASLLEALESDASALEDELADA